MGVTESGGRHTILVTVCSCKSHPDSSAPRRTSALTWKAGSVPVLQQKRWLQTSRFHGRPPPPVSGLLADNAQRRIHETAARPLSCPTLWWAAIGFRQQVFAAAPGSSQNTSSPWQAPSA